MNEEITLIEGDRALAGENDWAQLCLYSGGRAMEIDLSPAQLNAVAMALGLWQGPDGLGTAASDELLEREVLPLLLRGDPEDLERVDEPRLTVDARPDTIFPWPSHIPALTCASLTFTQVGHTIFPESYALGGEIQWPKRSSQHASSSSMTSRPSRSS